MKSLLGLLLLFFLLVSGCTTSQGVATNDTTNPLMKTTPQEILKKLDRVLENGQYVETNFDSKGRYLVGVLCNASFAYESCFDKGVKYGILLTDMPKNPIFSYDLYLFPEDINTFAKEPEIEFLLGDVLSRNQVEKSLVWGKLSQDFQGAVYGQHFLSEAGEFLVTVDCGDISSKDCINLVRNLTDQNPKIRYRNGTYVYIRMSNLEELLSQDWVWRVTKPDYAQPSSTLEEEPPQ